MKSIAESYLKVNYLMRPSKQLERKLFVEVLHRLGHEGYPICDYTYLGLGSVYYADFIMLYKYLYIDKMICVEAGPIPKRMEFNLPFDSVKLEMQKVSAVIPKLDRNARYIVWLDYDTPLDKNVLEDVRSLIYVLAPGSVFLVTVDAEPRLDEELDERETKADRERRAVGAVTDALASYYPGTITSKVMTRFELPRFYATVLRTLCADEMTKRSDCLFLQLFNFRYSDTAQMLSIGGLIDKKSEITKIRASKVCRLPFVNQDAEPLRISVPPLTVREKQYLDKNLAPNLKARNLPFELEDEMLESFRRYYRHYPTYFETLV